MPRTRSLTVFMVLSLLATALAAYCIICFRIVLRSVSEIGATVAVYC
jgi:hypothetical protein